LFEKSGYCEEPLQNCGRRNGNQTEKPLGLAARKQQPGICDVRFGSALQMFVGSMKQLRALADEHADKFESDGFKTLFAMIKKSLMPHTLPSSRII